MPSDIAESHELQRTIEELHARYQSLTDGAPATYIPELARVDPERFGVSIVTSDGAIFGTGHTEHLFTIQSISKPFTFGMAIEEFGTRVSEYVGVEPSGDVFNSIQLQNGSNRPHNPMINAGAITVTALLHSRYGDDTFERILERFTDAAGRRLTVNDAVYESERRTGHRNRAIAYLLLNFGLVHEDAERALDVYFKQCSIEVTTRDLAMMGGTLANLGRHPLTRAAAFDVTTVKSVLSIMLTCGMYDYSGEWAFRVGVPAKSGVAGGVLAVVNRQLAIATYSPRLDAHGNSTRGIEVCVELANRFGLHAFDCSNLGSGFLQVVL
jgi:glutaminase